MNLPPSEALNQIMDNLNHLNMIVNEAVHTISSRIKQESELLSSISKRVDAAYQKTAVIASNQHRSTTIYSSSTFPTAHLEVGTTQPLINKLSDTAPTAAARSTYQLSLKQRNERPENMETVSLLQSINEKTSNALNAANQDTAAALEASKIPDWVSSVADCLVFDTNRNAYHGRCNRDAPVSMRRRRRKYAKKRQEDGRSEKPLASAPKSIADPWYNARQKRKTYGDRVRYLPESARKTMPQFAANNKMVFGEAAGLIANDIEWREEENDEEEVFMIPTEVLNKQFGEEMDDAFEFGDDVKPPPMVQAVAVNEPSPAVKREIDNKDKQMHPRGNAQREEPAAVKVFAYPTPRPVGIAMVDQSRKNEESKKEEEQEQPDKDSQRRPVITDVQSQREWLQETEQNQDKPVNEKKPVEIKPVVVNERQRPFDAAALINARALLKPQEKELKDKDQGAEEQESDNPLQRRLVNAMSYLRQFHVDSDDEENPNDSFSD
eukprot:CAMPEP_0197037610 /NCGR_PEP_ID=MMETSP1384-20130603/14770_1 /TAXON_ID=29189 /ORGANISM="Ammonia sp." /LENGTH=493 /DNA_ID=CAMNT_0042467931 /DNA_START=75 /DNA_END=1556 /DNA_ORIENTATION=-